MYVQFFIELIEIVFGVKRGGKVIGQAKGVKKLQ
jgi:hypothetical protein